MKIAITANPEKPSAFDLVRRTVELIGDRAEIVLAQEARIPVDLSLPRVPLADLAADAIVAIGGDGTYLSILQRTNVPLLAVNAGTVGVLAEVDGRDAPEFETAIGRLLKGYYFVEERMKLAVQAAGTAMPDATNEVVIHSGRPAKMGRFDIILDGRHTGRLQADGVIIATPTGSTGYSLSALGPIVETGVEGIVIVAIAPFRAVARALVIEPLHTITIRPQSGEIHSLAVVDGQVDARVPPGGSVLAYRSPRRARFIRFGATNLSHLRGKGILPWAEAPEEKEGPDGADVPPPA
ncbi:MAG: NAD(+)/NADH kinase [Thermoplasmata archaeon]